MTAEFFAMGAAFTVKQGPVANARVVVGDKFPHARCQPADRPTPTKLDVQRPS